MFDWARDLFNSLQNPESTLPAIVLVWTLVGAALLCLLLPRGRTLARQVFALATLGFREGLRLKVLWTVLVLSLIPGAIAYFSDADGTHAGRARLILDTCISSGELLGASLIVLLAALSLAREIESRIMHTLGAKPIPRWTILAGKALGFWGIDLCFLALLMAYCGILVRAVPLRAETQSATALDRDGVVQPGTWAHLARGALTTRIYSDPKVNAASTSDYVLIRPGKTEEWTFDAPDENAAGKQRSLRFSISSNNSFMPQIPDLTITAFAPGQAPFLKRTETVPEGRPFEIFLDPKTIPGGEIRVAIHAAEHSASSKFPPMTLIVGRATGVRMGLAADGFTSNLVKSFFLMAIQGWVLAIITASWSGVLSFPVTVALGVIFVLSGEMSRNVIELLKYDIARTKEVGLVSSSADALQTQTIERLQTLLSMFPDFRAAGGPSAFVEGKFVPALALAHAALWMGIVRGLCWALPGFLAFQKREVGK